MLRAHAIGPGLHYPDLASRPILSADWDLNYMCKIPSQQNLEYCSIEDTRLCIPVHVAGNPGGASWNSATRKVALWLRERQTHNGDTVLPAEEKSAGHKETMTKASKC